MPHCGICGIELLRQRRRRAIRCHEHRHRKLSDDERERRARVSRDRNNRRQSERYASDASLRARQKARNEDSYRRRRAELITYARQWALANKERRRAVAFRSNERRRLKRKIVKECLGCGAPITQPKRRLYCSNSCSRRVSGWLYRQGINAWDLVDWVRRRQLDSAEVNDFLDAVRAFHITRQHIRQHSIHQREQTA